MAQKTTLANIQALRAVAALLVLLHHLGPHYEAMGGRIAAISHLSRWGFAGVDIFFVISGFIMAYTTFDKPRGIGAAATFLKHRFARIYLGYWPFFFVMLGAIALFHTQKLDDLDIPGSFFLTQPDMFKLVLPVSWSLTYELYFYLLFFFTFFLPVGALRWLMPAVTAMLALFAYRHIGHPFFFSPFLLEFFAGVLLYVFKERLLHPKFFLLALLLTIYGYTNGIAADAKNGLIRIETFGLGAASLVWFMQILENHGLYRAGEWLKKIGDASYSLYLSHLILLQALFYLGVRKFFSVDSSMWLPLTGLLVYIAVVVAFSRLYHVKVERPAYRWAISFSWFRFRPA